LTQGRVVIVDDDKANLETIKKALDKVNFETVGFSDSQDALNFIESNDSVDLVLTDLRMPKITGTDLLKRVKQKDQSIGVILITAYGTVENAVEAIKMGADDYIGKPLDIYELRKKVSAIVEKRNLSKEVTLLKSRLDERYGFENIIANSSKMKEVLEKVKLVANTKATVLIIGESGTGKELIANAIHQNSPRKSMPFLPINCAAIPGNLMESELFGYEKGAFTGADKAHLGRFEQADSGTLLLDEIAELPLELQGKLLRVLEEKVVYRVGGTKGIPVDVRIVAATHQNLLEKVKEGKFREDLYFRLKVVELIIPPLRERKEDIPFFVHQFLYDSSKEHNKNIKSVSSELLNFFENYEWKGNVRELKNLIERMVIFSNKEILDISDLPSELAVESFAPDQEGVSNIEKKDLPFLNLELLEKEAIIKALEETNYNKTQAAKVLGIGLRTLHRKINEYKIVERR
jgi:DNA-binding NtrC family response regulator